MEGEMRVYGNLMNRISEARRPITPEVGMGATVVMYSDRHAATIVAVCPNSVAIREDKSIRIDSNGMCDSQDYRYEPNSAAPVRWFSLRKNGRYVEKGSEKHNGTILVIGERDSYHDYSF